LDKKIRLSRETGEGYLEKKVRGYVDQANLLNLEGNKGDAKKSLKIAKSEMDRSIFMVPKAIEAYNEASEILKGSKYEANTDCVDAGRVASVESIQTKTGSTFKNSIGMEFVQIPAGSFEMGCSEGDIYCEHDEVPRHRVNITKPFYMGKYEVTQGQWMSVMGSGFFGIGGNNPSRFSSCGGSCPVEKVSWNNVQDYIQKLCKKENMNPCRYRLPTEAEWEYSARAGTKSKFYWGNKMDNSYLWFAENSEGQTHPVGQKKPNAWGLYDMTGNVFEWVQDWYDDEYYKNSPSADPKGADKGEYRVLHGGSWSYDAGYCRLSKRFNFDPYGGNDDYGFRLVLLP
jgi:formylglycine-generating enzyme required for sulfatase activity